MATSMSDQTAPPAHKGGGGLVVLAVGLAAVGGGAWWLTHRGASTPAPVGACPSGLNQAQTLWRCVLGNGGDPGTSDPTAVMLGHIAYLVQTGQLSESKAVAGFIPGACGICWDRLPSGCSNAC